MGTGLFLKNLTVEGRVYFSSPFYGGRDDDATNAGISNCTVRTTGTSTIYDHLGAVYISMNSSNVSIEDSSIDSDFSGIGLSYMYYPDTITLKNLTIRIASAHYANFGISESPYGRYEPTTGKYLKITNVDVQGVGDSAILLASGSYAILDNVKISNKPNGISTGWYRGLTLNGGSVVKIVNSKIQVPDTYAVGTNGGEIQIDNSNIQGKIAESASTIKIGNSKLEGVQLIGTTIKIVNSYDSNYDPIQNGTYGNLIIP
jgi:hypothetical protein